MPIEPGDAEIMEHALGIDRTRRRRKRDWCYRNHYCAGTGHHAEARVARLCEAGLMVDCGRQPLLRPGERLYRVTAEGGAFLKLPKYLRARLGFGPPPAKP